MRRLYQSRRIIPREFMTQSPHYWCAAASALCDNIVALCPMQRRYNNDEK